MREAYRFDLVMAVRERGPERERYLGLWRYANHRFLINSWTTACSSYDVTSIVERALW